MVIKGKIFLVHASGDYTLICESFGNYTFQFFNPKRERRQANEQALSHCMRILLLSTSSQVPSFFDARCIFERSWSAS